MKQKNFFMLIMVFAALCLFLPSCNEQDSAVTGFAPNNVAGKTLTINGTSAGIIHIVFSSNNAARITHNDGSSQTFSSISYSKTSANAATVRINGIYIDFGGNFGSISATDDENLSLIFSSSSQGIVNGWYSRRWNDGRTTSGSIEYETFTIF